MKNIGFIGLGNMGIYMSNNLSKSGFNVTGYDTNKNVFNDINNSKINRASSLDELYKNQDCIITMLPNGNIVSDVWKKLFKKITFRTLLIDCSTIDIKTAKSLYQEAKRNKILALDAPVSGGTIGAENKTLTFMVGGEKQAYQKALPIFKMMGKKSIFCGECGSGQAIKMCNNLLLASTMSSLGEVIKIAEKFDLNKEKLFDVISTSTGSCWALNSYCPIKGIGPNSPADNEFKPGFSSKLMLKDLLIAQEASQGLNLEIAKLVLRKYEKLVVDGKSDLDFSSIVN